MSTSAKREISAKPTIGPSDCEGFDKKFAVPTTVALIAKGEGGVGGEVGDEGEEGESDKGARWD